MRSAAVTIVRNFRMVNSRPRRPTRTWRKRPGDRRAPARGGRTAIMTGSTSSRIAWLPGCRRGASRGGRRGGTGAGLEVDLGGSRRSSRGSHRRGTSWSSSASESDTNSSPPGPNAPQTLNHGLPTGRRRAGIMGREAAPSAGRSDVDFWNSTEGSGQTVVHRGRRSAGHPRRRAGRQRPHLADVHSGRVLGVGGPSNLPSGRRPPNPYLATTATFAVAARVVASGMNQPSGRPRAESKGATGISWSTSILTVLADHHREQHGEDRSRRHQDRRGGDPGVQPLLADRQKTPGAPRTPGSPPTAWWSPRRPTRPSAAAARRVRGAGPGWHRHPHLAFAIEGMAQGRGRARPHPRTCQPAARRRPAAPPAPAPYSPPPQRRRPNRAVPTRGGDILAGAGAGRRLPHVPHRISVR